MTLDEWLAALEREDAKRAHATDPVCVGCGRIPAQIPEYADAAAENDYLNPNGPADYVRAHEGTYNPRNGHFLCTECYEKAGMPSSPSGWIAP